MTYTKKSDMITVDEKAEVDMVNQPPHYTRKNAMECIDEMEFLFGTEAVIWFCKCNAWKYRYRSADKNGAEDIAKSDWYMNKAVELTNKKKQNLANCSSVSIFG